MTTLLRWPWIAAACLALAATALASFLASSVPRLTIALDWMPYDAWAFGQGRGPGAPPVVLVTRDAASETRFGSGAWDRAVLARLIGALHQAGATVIGLPADVEHRRGPGEGTAASDALLLEAIRDAGVVMASNDMRATDAGMGHGLLIPDADGLIRRVPLFRTDGGHPVPAFGLVLALRHLHVAENAVSWRPGDAVTLPDASPSPSRSDQRVIPLDRDNAMLIRYGEAASTVSIAEVWDAIEHGARDRLRARIADHVVLMITTPEPAIQRPTPIGPLTTTAIHAAVVATLLGPPPPTNAAPGLGLPATLALSMLVAWLLLAFGGWIGAGVALIVAAGYAAIVLASVWLGTLILPWVLPALGLLLSSAGALLWQHLTARQRLRLLERDMLKVQDELAAARQALVYRESAVEALEEDVEAARATVARTTTAQEESTRTTEELRKALAQAQSQENEARIALEQLEHQLAGLRAVRVTSPILADAEQERLRAECERLGIVTCEPGVLLTFRDLKKAARAMLPVLVLGEPGTGKELVARAVHRLSPRASGPFVAVNAAAIAPDLFEAEMFGHVRGSFTGAMADRRGLFAQADGGTLFLDEVGDLRLEHQGKLLRVLQDKTFHRIGDTSPTRVDVRIVAATNRDLQRGVAEGWFREDLYFRLTGVVVRLPALRDRVRDIPLLAERFLKESAGAAGRRDMGLSGEALAALQRHPWRGNVRELRQRIEQAVTLADGTVLTPDDLRLTTTAGMAAVGPAREADPYGDSAVLNCLRSHDFDMQATAKALGWDRSTVTQRLKGMSFRALVEAEGDQSRAALALAGDAAMARPVALKIAEYHDHLMATVRHFTSADEAVAACRKRFKNLPERHFKYLETLVRQSFTRR
jgi:DNA-binding NtrC family response regulator/CHASE2 domain-containing sensor protein